MVRPTPTPTPTPLFSSVKTETTAWIKTGIEYYESHANLSTVATAPGSTSDWSLLPLEGNSVTLEVERETVDDKGHGASLWVYLVQPDGVRRGVREVTWPFADGPLLDSELFVGLYVARPTQLPSTERDEAELQVQFTQFVLN